MVGVIVTTPAGRKSRLFVKTIAGGLDADKTIRYLKDLKRHMNGKKLLLIWDGLPAHRAKKVGEYLELQKTWLKTERLPAYAPELNPIEYCWGAMKKKHFGNLRADGMSNLGTTVRGVCRRMDDSAILKRFLKASHLY